MIKCPNCGSTAQVKQTYYEYDDADGSDYHFYKCGCGTEFRIDSDLWDYYYLNYNGEKTRIDNPYVKNDERK
jgi:hypothetical protein